MSVILAMCLYSFSMSISPGPVNIIAMTSAINIGFKNTMPFVSGATIGFISLFLSIGLGLDKLTITLPVLMTVLTYIGIAFMAYIGFKITQSTGALNSDCTKSVSFSHGFLLQWLNPKAWIASISGIAAFNPDNFEQLLLFVLIYFCICYLSITCWAFTGTKMSYLFTTANNLNIFNLIMGSILILVAGYLLLMQLYV
ncbi:LysE family translocator [Pseudoalteromonas denitrificans]|uniref:Threonine/homoserine/homoserine lactone efflux protein n=1 Tax=Pseudoalteromonas denitrificans DSM 6059 TaxID=1123010 RepID=A0A1I1UE22_9GAMM|nr:LysE family translocator [Pseudoalteromonas denitrificans]SFD69071.1 Threonine/homoserine/homoserine lactone efflux protein [Pseudoalteromonas denitrificans DSM 6059]